MAEMIFGKRSGGGAPLSTLCKDGKIAEEPEKQGKRWMIPADTQKP